MAIFIGFRKIIWAKCLYVVRHTGGVYRASDNTWPFLFYVGLSGAVHGDFLKKNGKQRGHNGERTKI
jgi:hypothetical protein